MGRRKVKMCLCTCERESPKENKNFLSLVFSSSLSQATEINLFYANSIWAFSFICIFSFLFHLFASWNSLLQVIGFSIFLLCLSSWSKRHSDEATESANSGTKTVIYTTDGSFFNSGLQKELQQELSVQEDKDRNLTCWLYCETFLILFTPFNCLIANYFPLISVS